MSVRGVVCDVLRDRQNVLGYGGGDLGLNVRSGYNWIRVVYHIRSFAATLGLGGRVIAKSQATASLRHGQDAA